MQVKTRTEELLREIATSVVPTEDAELARARRDRVVARLTGLVQATPVARQSRRRLARMGMVGCAAALAVVAGLMAARPRPQAQPSDSRVAPSAVLALEGSVEIIRRAAPTVVPSLERVAVGDADEVATAKGGRARALLGSGAEVDIDPESKVRFRAADHVLAGDAPAPQNRGEAVVLGAGRVTVRVPKLVPARTFAVETPEAMVVVHGTTFSVERTAHGPDVSARTTVDVEEGTVAVRYDGREVVLHGGDHWSSEVSDLDPVPRTVDHGPSRPKVGSVQRAGKGSTKGSAELPPPGKDSSLAAENRLLQTAMAARQQGDARRAVQLAGELVSRFPGSPLVEEARVERMRALLNVGGAVAAASEARSYLADYPQGFARHEANRILAAVR
jgi:hypothetical protein